MLSSSVAAKRSLFSQPKVSRVYPDTATGKLTTANSTGIFGEPDASAASAVSEESAYQSGSCSPEQALTAAQPASAHSAPANNKLATEETDDNDFAVLGGGSRKSVHFHSASPCRSSSSCSSPSCEASRRAHFHIVTVSEQVDRAERSTSFDQLAKRRATIDSVGVSRRFSIADAAALQTPLPPTQQPELLLSPDEEQEILEASGEEFKERLKRLFGVRHSIASPNHHHHHHHHHNQQERGSSPDLKQSWSSVAGGAGQSQGGPGGPPGPRGGRRPSLAARLFNKLPFVRKNDPDSEDDDSDEGGGSANGLGGGSGAAGGGSTTLRYCEVCGETECELHGSLSDMNCCRRHLTLLGCYQTKEERERALMLENNSAARVTTLLVVLVFLSLIFALIALSALGSSSNSSSSSAASSSSTTTVSYGPTTT